MLQLIMPYFKKNRWYKIWPYSFLNIVLKCFIDQHYKNERESGFQLKLILFICHFLNFTWSVKIFIHVIWKNWNSKRLKNSELSQNFVILPERHILKWIFYNEKHSKKKNTISFDKITGKGLWVFSHLKPYTTA